MISSAGIVSGLSGPVIMSGLASYGALFAGGAVAGLLTLSAIPTLASVTIMHHALRPDERHPRP
jgi:hypothetical protein